jgi:hypothetical protein
MPSEAVRLHAVKRLAVISLGVPFHDDARRVLPPNVPDQNSHRIAHSISSGSGIDTSSDSSGFQSGARSSVGLDRTFDAARWFARGGDGHKSTSLILHMQAIPGLTFVQSAIRLDSRHRGDSFYPG